MAFLIKSCLIIGSFFMAGNSLKLGFIPDIVCTMYSLEDYLQRYNIATGLFPTKAQWKRISRNVINGLMNTT